MSQSAPRTFSRAFKLKAIERMEAGENVSALAEAVSVKRALLYRWRDAFRAGGALALRSARGRPKKAEARAMAAARGPAAATSALTQARRKIAELERKVGQQQLELDFFLQALRQVKGARRPSDGSGVTGSTRSCKR
jgi:transposase-like protein